MLAVTIGLVTLISYPSRSIDPDQIFVEFYHPYTSNLNASSPYLLQDMQKAINHYNRGNIASALDEFEKLELENAELSGFYTALCYIEMGHITKAESKLKSLEDEAIFYADDIEWYLSLCCLKNRKTKGAIALLQHIVPSGNRYAHKASRILDRLDLD